jgi:hypothetical protein
MSVYERTKAVGVVTTRRSLREACFSSLYLLSFITNRSQILNFAVYNVWIQVEFIKSRQRFNRDHKTWSVDF